MNPRRLSIGLLFGTLFIVSPLVGLLPGSLGTDLSKIMPSNAGESFTSVTQTKDMLSPSGGALVFALWFVVLLAAAAFTLRHRDA